MINLLMNPGKTLWLMRDPEDMGMAVAVMVRKRMAKAAGAIMMMDLHRMGQRGRFRSIFLLI